MQVTADQIGELAPDSSSLAAGKKLAAMRSWQDVACSNDAIWGQCQGSAIYQVKIDLSNLAYHCSCPSRKFPCKHVLGLLILAAESPAAIPRADQPGWVDEWLARRRAREDKKSTPTGEKPKRAVDEQAAADRQVKREARIEEGIDRLNLWMNDLVRNGLAGLESQAGGSLWDEQAKRLVDAQAPALASRVSKMSMIPGAGRDWPERLLAELGRLKLLVHAARRLDLLPMELRDDLRQLIGWTVNQADLESRGERVMDLWTVIGQWVDDDERLRAQRSWVVGQESGRTALILQFAPGGQPFAESILPGTRQAGELMFYPGQAAQRARFAVRTDPLGDIDSRITGSATVNDFLERISEQLSRQPFLSAFGCVLHDVTFVPGEERWHVRDRQGESLPLLDRQPWKHLALTGGRPCDVTGEWDGEQLRLLGLVVEGRYRLP